MPEKLTCQLPFYVTESQRAQLKDVSALTRIPQQALMREALQTVLNKHARPTNDDVLGAEWWNGLSEAERARWQDIAWRRNGQAAGRISYKLDDMPSARDAWLAFKAGSEVKS